MVKSLFPFLLFIDEIECCSKIDVINIGEPNPSPRERFALFCPTLENHCAYSNIEEILTDSGISVIKQQITPPNNAQFQAVEIIIEFCLASLCIYCDPFNLQLLCRLFINRVDLNFKGAIPIHAAKIAMLNDSDVNLIANFLVAQPNMPFRDSKSSTLLHLAIERGYVTLFEVLLQLEANVNQARIDGSVPLHSVVEQIDHQMWFAQKLLEQRANVNASTETGLTPLHKAVEAECFDVIRLFLKNGANANARTLDDDTPLHLAGRRVTKITFYIVQLLLRFNADTQVINDEGATPLMYFYSSPQILKLLIENGAIVDFETINERTVLLESVKNQYFKSAEYILSRQPNVNVVGNRKAFYTAIANPRAESAELVLNMLERGFTIQLEAVNTPELILGAIDKGLVDIVERLLGIGISVNQPSIFYLGKRITPLELALKKNNEEIVRLLLERGAVIRSPRRTFISPLFTAVEFACPKIIGMLFNANASDRLNPLLLFSAVRNARFNVVLYLLAAGHDPNSDSWFSWLGDNPNRMILTVLILFGAHCKYESLEILCEQSFTAIGMFLQEYLNSCPADTSTFDGSLCRFSDFITVHLMKMEVLLPEIRNTDEFGNIMKTIYFERLNLDNFKRKCEDEVQILGEEIGDTRVHFRDILTKDVHHVASFVRNRIIEEAIRRCADENRFPIYGKILYCKFQMGIWFQSVINKTVPALKQSVALFTALPEEVIFSMFQFLSLRDLISLLVSVVPVQNIVTWTRQKLNLR